VQREELEHLIRAAGDVTREYSFIIVGSQSILGSIPAPPAELTMSMEADLYPRDAPEKADLIDGQLGEGSSFHVRFGFYGQGVGPETAVLPEGWEERLHRVQNANTNLFEGWCLDVADLFMAKAVANRDKDREFDMALLQHGFVKLKTVLTLVDRMPMTDEQKRSLRARIRRWAKMVQDRGFVLSED
jgi:hypothetical protein